MWETPLFEKRCSAHGEWAHTLSGKKLLLLLAAVRWANADSARSERLDGLRYATRAGDVIARSKATWQSPYSGSGPASVPGLRKKDPRPRLSREAREGHPARRGIPGLSGNPSQNAGLNCWT